MPKVDERTGKVGDAPKQAPAQPQNPQPTPAQPNKVDEQTGNKYD